FITKILRLTGKGNTVALHTLELCYQIVFGTNINNIEEFNSFH
ncbi:13655_t:CDS:2, partial [Racocetra fulgida]